MLCPKCATEVPDDYNFCELDGTPLHAPVKECAAKPTSFCRCGAIIATPDEDGFCAACGELWERRNHLEYYFGANFAAITDRGTLHSRNEDSVRLAVEENEAGKFHILIVCDGLSSAQRSSEASECASQTALASLSKDICNGLVDPLAAMNSAIIAAHHAVCALESDSEGHKELPGTTIVAAFLHGNRAVIGWVGDSRAYLVSPSETKLLTRDHSWVNEVVESGQLAEEEAMGSLNAHVITHCIGPVETQASGAAPIPSVVSMDLPDLCTLLLCSDGLWNYAEKLEDFDSLMKSAFSEVDALAVGKYLVAFANSKGGRDNITVALTEVGSSQSQNAV
ncbi:N/A [soil metagenome]